MRTHSVKATGYASPMHALEFQNGLLYCLRCSRASMGAHILGETQRRTGCGGRAREQHNQVGMLRTLLGWIVSSRQPAIAPVPFAHNSMGDTC
jgi:hypothetical protein